MVQDYTSSSYRRSRLAYLIECAFEYFVSLLVCDSFLAKLLSTLGFSDAQIGILSSFISLAFLFQLCAIPFVRKVTNVKRFAVLFHTTGQLFFMALYLVPFFRFDNQVHKFLMPCLILIAYFGNYFVTSSIYNWGSSFVNPHNRGSYQASKEMVSLLSGVFVSLLLGFVIDKFEANNNLFGGFLFAAISIAIFCLCDLICLLFMQNQKAEPANDASSSSVHSMRDIWTNTMGNKSFRCSLYFSVLWYITRYASLGFVGIYKTDTLLLSLTVIQIISIGGQMARFAVSKPFGKLADKTSYVRASFVGLFVSLSGYAFLIFTSPGAIAKWFIVGYVVLDNASLAGIHQNTLMMTYDYVDHDYFVEATALKTSISGLCGFGVSILCSRLLDCIQRNGNSFLGFHVYGQQILGIISFMLCIATMVFAKAILQKQKPVYKENCL